jgi:hypothetical protein
MDIDFGFDPAWTDNPDRARPIEDAVASPTIVSLSDSVALSASTSKNVAL